MNQELPGVQAGFRKGRGTRVQIVNIGWIMKKAREFQKKHLLCLIVYAKAFDLLRLTRNCRKILKSWEYQTTNLYEGQEAQLEPDMEQWTVSKLGKQYDKAVYCHPVYLNYM